MALKEEVSHLLGLQHCFSGLNFSAEESRVIFYGAPLDCTTSFKSGTKDGPDALRNASCNIETFSWKQKKEFFDVVKTHDLGNLEVFPGDIPKTLQRIREMNETIVKHGKIPFMLGGEHTASVGAIRAFEQTQPLVVHFDAHFDFRDEFEGTPYNHAAALRRVLDYIPPQNLAQFGIRSSSQEEFDFAKEKKIRFFSAEDIHSNLDKAKQFLSQFTKGKPFYLTFDLDAFDMSIVPGTGTPEPNGLSYEEVFQLLSSIQGKPIGMDIVEIAPDSQKITQTTAAKLAYELLSMPWMK